MIAGGAGASRAFGVADPFMAPASGQKHRTGTLAAVVLRRAGALNPKAATRVTDLPETPPMRIIGVILIVLGALALIFQGITYTRERQVIDVGPIEATAEEERTIPVPPVVGALLMVAGVALVWVGGRRPT